MNDINGSLTQVLAEISLAGEEICYYTRGHELISQERNGEVSTYLTDGHFSVRNLADEDGKVTDSYDYDAWGNMISSVGTTKNSFLYCGEQQDSTTGNYYLRARYMSPNTGTFITQDVYQGSIFEPLTLHKYLYAHANPVMNSDPSGYMVSLLDATTVSGALTMLMVDTLSSSMITFGISLIKELQAVEQGSQLQIDWNNVINRTVEDFLLSALTSCVSLLTIGLSSIAILLALGSLGLITSTMGLAAVQQEWEDGNYFFALIELYHAINGIRSSYSNFNTAGNIASYTPPKPQGQVKLNQEGHNWESVSLTETVNRIAPEAKPVYDSYNMEVRYTNENTKQTVIYYTEGNYIRIVDKTIIGNYNHVNQYGEQVPIDLNYENNTHFR